MSFSTFREARSPEHHQEIIMSVSVLYTTAAIATGGRDGRAATTDGAFEVRLARPKELGGDGAGNNPEQLFAAGYSACFLSALQFVASQDRRRIPPDAQVKAVVGIGPRSEGGFGLDIALEVTLPGLENRMRRHWSRRRIRSAPTRTQRGTMCRSVSRSFSRFAAASWATDHC
jgi:Ohr subfamily peroxiredoxin